ncbi:MAG: HAD-IA family hydrolase [Dehalococcoidia bacterium]
MSLPEHPPVSSRPVPLSRPGEGLGERLKPKVILFDLDDTLIDHSGNLESSWEPVLERATELIEGLNPAELRQAIREAAEEYWSDRARHREGRLDLKAARQLMVRSGLERMGLDPTPGNELGALYHQTREEGYGLLPGAIETLETLRERGVRLGLVTNGEALLQRSKIERFELARHFDHIQIEEEFGLGKPEEKVYLHALATLGTKPEEAWMVGDNLEWEIAAPQRLGIYAIWVDRSGDGLPADSEIRPDRIIRSVNELV